MSSANHTGVESRRSSVTRLRLQFTIRGSSSLTFVSSVNARLTQRVRGFSATHVRPRDCWECAVPTRGGSSVTTLYGSEHSHGTARRVTAGARIPGRPIQRRTVGVVLHLRSARAGRMPSRTAWTLHADSIRRHCERITVASAPAPTRIHTGRRQCCIAILSQTPRAGRWCVVTRALHR